MLDAALGGLASAYRLVRSVNLQRRRIFISGASNPFQVSGARLLERLLALLIRHFLPNLSRDQDEFVHENRDDDVQHYDRREEGVADEEDEGVPLVLHSRETHIHAHPAHNTGWLIVFWLLFVLFC